MKDVRREVIRNHFSDIETIDAILDGDPAAWKDLDVQIIERLSKHRNIETSKHRSKDVRYAIA
jgi:hypothetical protein